MEMTYDSEADAASILFTPIFPGISRKSFPIDINGRAFTFDFNDAGQLVSIEILDASTILPGLKKMGADAENK